MSIFTRKATDPAHVRHSEQVLDKLDGIADRIEGLLAELRETTEAERDRD